LEESLARSENVKDKMLEILDRFEDRFSKLEIEMNSMNKRIDVLKLAHDSMKFYRTIIYFYQILTRLLNQWTTHY
jgi:hypothetical protein